MKRKVIQIANSTQLVSLPRKWCKEHGIKKGDELEVIEEQDSIQVKVNPANKEPERLTVNVGGLGYSVRTLVSALYKGGYDEFKIFFNNADELRHVQTIVKESCFGFEIVEQGRNFVIARKISEPIPDEFDAVLRRTFIFLQNMVKETSQAIRTGDADALNTVIAMDASINKFTYFCRRVLNKFGRGPYRVTSPLYYLVDELEEIADKYKNICKVKLEYKKKLSKPLLDLFDKVNSMVELLVTTFYKFDWKKLNELYGIKLQINEIAPDVMHKITKNEFPILLNILVIADKIFELDGPIVLSRYQPTIEKQQ